MLDLRTTQLAFLDVISAPDGVEAALWDSAGVLENLVVGDRRLGAAGRLGVYADMYRLRLRAALASSYPFTHRLVGESAFATLADRYFAVHPSRSPSLRDGGAAFAAFLAANSAGWVVDLARLEWARHDVFDAIDEPVLDLPAVHARGPAGLAELPVRLVRAHRLCAVEHAVVPAWRALALDTAPRVRGRTPGVVLVWREGVSVFHRALDPVEAELLAAADEGLAFGSICERLGDAARASKLLLRWLGDHLLVRP